jgi:hypothetical protein
MNENWNTHALPCIVCAEPLRRVESGGRGQQPRQPSGGVSFYGHGGYGSRHDLDHFLISVCDQCLIDHAQSESIMADQSPAAIQAAATSQSDPSAETPLREQLNIALRASCRDPLTVWQRAGAIEALFPLVTAFGDAREAAGREQGRQDAAEETEAARRWLVEQGARPTMADVERLRGSGVAVQPTPEEQP